MFGQEPRLPLDFLLGRVESPVNGSVHEWVQEHQARLQVAFEGARERLQQAVGRRKRAHDQHVKDLPLREGQWMFLRDFSARGPYKTRDRWSSVRYQVLRAPAGGGSVYTIVPADNPTKVRQVHRKMLKAVVGAGPPGCAPSQDPPSVEEPLAENDCSFDYDLLVLRQQPPVTSAARPAISPTAVTLTPPQMPVLPSDSDPQVCVPLTAPHTGASNFVAAPPVSCPGPSNIAPRRTTRSTAGHHSNVYHIPRPVGPVEAAGPPAPVSNAVSALFRPWF